ncbi:MAG TPA: bifunctional diaminohydroxyphosphoribosylaminopyrimidine deaminase/5-amino-6-(5-phosphoribosylamino)uracil reductase RibD [Vicingus sp.]|nr:bifunctional diaminohydroxyphosphoribosylaminopyrimidine deaminase/5-amino-6-(5-phosphoribosylamino)uracil reductase RibD [Vicingus sp.]HRP59824.1 bifunctional diaminohydroxyphosphoribosylaminopyrimidine deaminase/5-amino-6-(5-phosphoribosylamino)uracil reductase RibD [Vicingus sp.]
MNFDEKYLLRCLELAKNGLGNVAPNPMVGCVIVFDGKIIGEGYHQEYGKAHAEVNAIHSVKDKSLLKRSTLYVNLEPCAHFGKTPPCANLIVEHHIPRVVIGCVDSFSEVSGKGIEKLKNAGIDVSVGVLEKESLELNKRFFTFHNKKRPYIILKWAETKDGFIDVQRINEIAGQTHIEIDNWITSPLSKQLVHKWRSEEAAIMVGTNTALNDNPQLNVREWKGENPTRVVVDLHDRLPQNLYVFDKSIPTLVFSLTKQEQENNLTFVKINDSKYLIKEILDELYKRNIQSIIIEGGATLLQSFIDLNLWDEARIFVGNRKFTTGLKAPSLKGNLLTEELIDVDRLKWIVNI